MKRKGPPSLINKRVVCNTVISGRLEMTRSINGKQLTKRFISIPSNDGSTFLFHQALGFFIAKPIDIGVGRIEKCKRIWRNKARNARNSISVQNVFLIHPWNNG